MSVLFDQQIPKCRISGCELPGNYENGGQPRCSRHKTIGPQIDSGTIENQGEGKGGARGTRPTVEGWYWYGKNGEWVGIEWINMSAKGEPRWLDLDDEYQVVPDEYFFSGPILEPGPAPVEGAPLDVEALDYVIDFALNCEGLSIQDEAMIARAEKSVAAYQIEREEGGPVCEICRLPLNPRAGWKRCLKHRETSEASAVRAKPEPSPMIDLDPEFKKVLHDNLFELYTPGGPSTPEPGAMGRMECREEAGGFLIEVDGRPIFTCSRGSHALDMDPGMTLPLAKSALFALGAKLLRVDERAGR